jgi:carbon-monoxide dehydrogenase medium subunit
LNPGVAWRSSVDASAPSVATLKPASFDYTAPDTMDEVLALLAEHGPEAKVLAGGQSLVPRMAFRLERPTLLVDIGRVSGLDGVAAVGGELSIGARVTHRRLELGVSPDPLGRLMALAGRHIGHLPIRVRGTFGGSLAYADPAAEWCLLATALGARVGIASAHGHRFVDAGDFFRTPLGTPFAPGDFFRTASSFVTALEPDELIDEVRLPLLGRSAGVGFAEFSRRENDSAFVSAAAAIVMDGGEVKRAFLGVGGRGTGPVRAGEAEAALLGSRLGRGEAADAARAAAAAVQPASDIHGSAEYRRGLVEVLVRRSIEQAANLNGRAAA